MAHKAPATNPDRGMCVLKQIPHHLSHRTLIGCLHGMAILPVGIIEFYFCQSYCLYQCSTLNTDKWGNIRHPQCSTFWEVTAREPNKNLSIFFSPRKHVLSSLLPHLHSHSFAVTVFAGALCDALSPLCNLTAGEEPRCISPATRVTNCRAPRASAVSEWRTATWVGATTGPFAEVKKKESKNRFQLPWCWRVHGDISFSCVFPWFSIHHFAATHLTLTSDRHSLAARCLAMLAKCYPSLMSSTLLTVLWQAERALMLPAQRSWCSCAPQSHWTPSIKRDLVIQLGQIYILRQHTGCVNPNVPGSSSPSFNICVYKILFKRHCTADEWFRFQFSSGCRHQSYSSWNRWKESPEWAMVFLAVLVHCQEQCMVKKRVT